MPRVSPSILKHAYNIEPLLAKLLPVCRGLDSAKNELRWLKDHARSHPDSNALLKSLVARRAAGEPLQYILGTEYFGNLELRCRPGVLIPRQETAASVTHLVQTRSSLLSDNSALRMLDLCTGSGCIPLLFHNKFYRQSTNQDRQLEILGVDISEKALALSKHNQEQQLKSPQQSPAAISSLRTLQFSRADVLSSGAEVQDIEHVLGNQHFQVMISNPPYISHRDHTTTTSPSVRKYEPKLALVPPRGHGTRDGDYFYPRLWAIADTVKAQMVLLEVADLDQAIRVADMASRNHEWQSIELWRDDPVDDRVDTSTRYKIIGNGNVRSVFAWRGTR